MSWTQIIIKAKVSKSFQKEVGSVAKRWRQNQSGEAKPSSRTKRPFSTQNLDAERMEGYMLEKVLTFISEQEFSGDLWGGHERGSCLEAAHC